MMNSRKILVPIDESDHSRQAFEFCISDVIRPNDIILLVNVFSPPSPPGICSKMIDQDMWDSWRVVIDKKVSSIKDKAKEYEDVCIEKKIRYKLIIHNGHPGEGICDIINEHKPCLVIMGTRGQNVLRRTVLGSVSDYVIHHADVPVIVTPPPSDLRKYLYLNQ